MSASNRPSRSGGQSGRGPRMGSGRWIVLAIGLLVPLVSMPRLEAFARNANESDALEALRVLAHSLFEDGAASLELSEVLAREDVGHRLGDARALDGNLWRYHGYLFQIMRPAQLPPVLLAWPRDCGVTGRPAFAAQARNRILIHSNRQAQFSGQGAPPDARALPTPETGEPGELSAAASLPAQARDGDGWRPYSTF